MDELQLSQQDFAMKLGISPASLSSIFTGRTNPTNNHVQAIHAAFPNISVNWLMFGEGRMYVIGDAPLGDAPLSENDDVANRTSLLPSSEGRADDVSATSAGGSSFAGGLFSAEATSAERTASSQIIAPQPIESEYARAASGRQNSAQRRAGAVYGSEPNHISGTAMKFDKQMRKIKEIRVFFDDGTYEAFVPSK